MEKELLKEIAERTVGMKESLERVEKEGGDIKSRLSDLEDWRKNYKPAAVSLPGCNEGKDKVEGFFSKAILGIATRDWNRIPEGPKVYDILTQTRDLNTVNDSKGGYVVPAEYMRELIEILRSRLFLRELGVREMGFSGSPVHIPRHSGAAVAESNAENSEITFTDQDLEEITLSPKMVDAGTKMSRRSAALSDPGIESLVRADLAEVLARKIDFLGIYGSGSSNEPRGLANVSGVGSVDMSGGASYEKLLEFEGNLEDNDALRGRVGFLMHPKGKRDFAKLKDADDRPLFNRDQDPTVKQPALNLIGYPWISSTAITASGGSTDMYFGNWEDMILGTWGNLLLEASMDAGDAFTKHQIWVKVVQEIDFAFRHPESFAKSTNLPYS